MLAAACCCLLLLVAVCYCSLLLAVGCCSVGFQVQNQFHSCFARALMLLCLALPCFPLLCIAWPSGIDFELQLELACIAWPCCAFLGLRVPSFAFLALASPCFAVLCFNLLLSWSLMSKSVLAVACFCLLGHVFARRSRELILNLNSSWQDCLLLLA